MCVCVLLSVGAVLWTICSTVRARKAKDVVWLGGRVMRDLLGDKSQTRSGKLTGWDAARYNAHIQCGRFQRFSTSDRARDRTHRGGEISVSASFSFVQAFIAL